MKKTQEKYLICPACKNNLSYIEKSDENDKSVPSLNCISCRKSYPIINGIPRFVTWANYGDSFGFQWKRFSKIQMDSYNNSGFSARRFQTITGWDEEQLAGKIVLDAGCGAGRFAEIVMQKYRANLVAFDLSNAVEACRDNLEHLSPLICQASIYEPPFRVGFFDYVYSIGVIQHTPKPHDAIRSLCKLVKPGGQIGLWIYEFDWKIFIGTAAFKYMLRPITRRLKLRQQINFCNYLTCVFYPVISVLKDLGVLGRILMRLLPVSSAHLQKVNLNSDDFKTWVFLDTFDMYTPAYDKPQKYSTIVKLLEDQGFGNIKRHPHGGIAVTAVRLSGT